MTNRPIIVLLHGVESSGRTWWRLAEDLDDLGWDVRTPDLLGHGSRRSQGHQSLSIAALAEDVRQQVGGPADLIVGHSLGAVVGLALLGQHPSFGAGIVIEDPPALNAALDPIMIAASIRQSVEATRTDPAAARAELLADNPRWSVRDADGSILNRLDLDVDRVSSLIESADWDLAGLVARCPVPVGLLAADTDSALAEPDRAAVMSAAPVEARCVIHSGHGIHRDRPGLWLRFVLQFAENLRAREELR